MLWRSILCAAATTAAIGTAGCSSSGHPVGIGAATTIPTTEAATTLPATTTSTTNPDNMLTIGSHSARVAALQTRLAALGYRPGAATGEFTADTSSAVLAFEKREGLDRDGVAGPIVQTAVATPKGAGPRAGLPTPRLEIDIPRQIAFVVLSGQSVITINVSTGSGMHYQDPQTKADDVAYTPVGSFAVERKIDKDVQAPLGTLHRPMYFYQGWAVHGSASVPGWPASHGCVRVSNSDADWLFPQVPVGTPVVIYDAKGKSPAPVGAAPGS